MWKRIEKVNFNQHASPKWNKPKRHAPKLIATLDIFFNIWLLFTFPDSTTWSQTFPCARWSRSAPLPVVCGRRRSHRWMCIWAPGPPSRSTSPPPTRTVHRLLDRRAWECQGVSPRRSCWPEKARKRPSAQRSTHSLPNRPKIIVW